MEFEGVELVYFSPTRTTKTILEGIASSLCSGEVKHVDLTYTSLGDFSGDKVRNKLILVGTPVYGGRVPPLAVQRLKEIRGNDSAAVPVVVYGNRAYEDALRELKDTLIKLGFFPIAGAAFIGEHSFSRRERPLAQGRPDAQDMHKASEFGVQVREKIRTITSLKEMADLVVPGNYPYKEPKIHESSPETDTKSCTLCGLCAEICPSLAISVEDQVLTDPTRCILCNACVKQCPEKARYFSEGPVVNIAQKLYAECKDRKEPEMFLGWEHE